MSDTDFWDADRTRDDNPVVRSDGGRRRRREKQKERKRKRRGSGAAAMASLVFLLLVVGGGGYFGYTELKAYMRPPDYTGEGGGKVTVEVKSGESTSAIAATLERAQVVKSAKAFVNAAKDEPGVQSIQPGFYLMRRHMSAEAAVTLILSPEARAGVIDVPRACGPRRSTSGCRRPRRSRSRRSRRSTPRNSACPRRPRGRSRATCSPAGTTCRRTPRPSSC